jgi:hypothetical protein
VRYKGRGCDVLALGRAMGSMEKRDERRTQETATEMGGVDA